MKQYFQCRLRRGQSETVAWIEARGAKQGAEVELLPVREMWTVAEVYEHGLPEDGPRLRCPAIPATAPHVAC